MSSALVTGTAFALGGLQLSAAGTCYGGGIGSGGSVFTQVEKAEEEEEEGGLISAPLMMATLGHTPVNILDGSPRNSAALFLPLHTASLA